VGDAPGRRDVAVARVGTELAAQEGEETGFSGTIGTDKTGFLAGMQGQLCAFEQTLGATL
jgi:hypothetical protein